MYQIKRNVVTSTTRLLPVLVAAVAVLLCATAYAAAPGITGPSFSLTAQASYITQPDGRMVYSWGYGCNGTPSGYAPAAVRGAFCNQMQIPGPTLIVTQGQTVTVKLTNNLPTAAGNTSILFPGFTLPPFTDGTHGLLTQEASPGQSVTYTFTATTPGTRAYYSGTQSDLQVEMGLYGAIIVLPSAANIPAACSTGLPTTTPAGNHNAQLFWHEADLGVFRLAPAAYANAATCYDREYLFQFSEMDPSIHVQAETQ